MNQLELPLPMIPHIVEGEIIQQRAVDGYINATAMCKAAGKKISHYFENKATKDFIKELSSDIGIPATEIILTIQGGTPDLQGTWVHPDVAIHLGQWLSPKFAVQVSRWVREWISGAIKPEKAVPYHLERYLVNRSAIPHTHFSILNEMTFSLIAPLESSGYRLPDNLVPDISEGKMFAKWLRDEKEIDTKALPTYTHRYQDGREVQAKMYPNSVLADFRKHFHEVWLPQKAYDYFETRDKKALKYLPKVLELPNSDKKALKK